MDLNSFLTDIESYADSIDKGRKGLATNGQEHAGHISYDAGIAGATAAFQEARASKDAQIMAMAELVFRQQELQYCDKADNEARSSLTKAVNDFEDALRSLEVVKNAAIYREAAKTHSTRTENCIDGCPKDIFHEACISNITRLHNSLRTPGINMDEKAFFKERLANMPAAQESYLELQKTALAAK